MKHTKSMIYSPSDESRELMLYAVNDGRLHDRMTQYVIQNLRKHYRRGKFDKEKAIDAFYPVATEAARMYCREFAHVEDAPHIFNVTSRFTVAVEMVDYYMDCIEFENEPEEKAPADNMPVKLPKAAHAATTPKGAR